MNYIFLDIDGVMNNRTDRVRKIKNNLERFKGHSMFCDEAWSLLASACRKTKAKIILSSSWRMGIAVYIEDGAKPQFKPSNENDYYTSKLLEYFSSYNIELVGLTTFNYDYRGNQIMQYVKEHFNDTDNWLVIDDEIDDMENIPKEKIIQINLSTGLLPEHCERIIKYFNKKKH